MMFSCVTSQTKTLTDYWKMETSNEWTINIIIKQCLKRPVYESFSWKYKLAKKKEMTWSRNREYTQQLFPMTKKKKIKKLTKKTKTHFKDVYFIDWICSVRVIMFCSADKKIYTTDIYLCSFPKKHYMVLRQEMQTTQKVHKTINLQNYIVYINYKKW